MTEQDGLSSNCNSALMICDCRLKQQSPQSQTVLSPKLQSTRENLGHGVRLGDRFW